MAAEGRRPERGARDRATHRPALPERRRHAARCGAGARSVGAGAAPGGGRRPQARAERADRPVHRPLPNRPHLDLRLLRPADKLLDRLGYERSGAGSAPGSARALAVRVQVPEERRPGRLPRADGQGRRHERRVPAQGRSEGRARASAARDAPAAGAAHRLADREAGREGRRRTHVAEHLPGALRVAAGRRRDPRARRGRTAELLAGFPQTRVPCSRSRADLRGGMLSRTVDSSGSALAGSRELLAAVLAHLGDGVVVHGAGGERLYANDQAARLTGYATAEELMSALPEETLARFELFHADGAPMRPEDLPGRRALAGEDPEPALVRFRPAAGGPDRVSKVVAVPVRDAHGVLLYVISYFRDVTEEPVFAAQAAAALENASLYREAKRTSALLDSLYDGAPIGLGFWDRDLRYVRVNEALAAINELAAEEHRGRTFAEVIPHLAPVLEPIARRVLETGEPVTALEMSAGTPSDPQAQRFWLSSYYPVLAADGEALGVGAVVEEVTDRRRAEQRTELQHAVTRILSVTDSVEAAVSKVLEAVCLRLGWDVGCYWPLDPEEPRLTWVREGVHVEGFVELTRLTPLSPALLPGRVAESGEAEWLEDLSPATFPRSSVAHAERLSSGVCFPILIEGEVAGVLEIFAQARRPRDPDIQQTLFAIGGQLGQFLRRKRVEDERAQLLQRERQARAEAESAAATLRKLARVSEVALDRVGLNELLEALLARIVEVLDADTAAILLIDPNGELGVRATTGLEGEHLEHARTIPLGSGMAGRVASTRTPRVISDLAQVELASPVLRQRGINSLVA